MIAETHHHLSTAGTLALVIPLGLVSFALLGVLVKMLWDERKPRQKPRCPCGNAFPELENRVREVEAEFGRKGIIAFMTRGQLEAKAVQKREGCPACGHKDG